jgi:hypothetical protein
MADDSNQYVAGLFQLGNTFATSFAKNLANDVTSNQTAQQTANANLRETIDYSRLNGSGPNDAATAADSAPRSLFDFINGRNAGSTTKNAVGGGVNWILIVGVIFAGVYLLLKNR